MHKLIFRSVFGGPALGPKYLQELRRIQEALKSVRFDYELDLLLRIGGDISTITDPTGLYNPRVSVAKRRVTATILINSDEALSSDDPAKLLSNTIHNAAIEILDRIAARDKEFDAEEAKDNLAFLIR